MSLKCTKSLIIVVGLFSLSGAPTTQGQEGAGMVVERISFQDVNSFSPKTLKEKMRTKEGGTFDEFQMRQDLKRIERFYREKGFLEAKGVEHKLRWNPERMSVDIVFTMDEGPRWRVDSLRIVGGHSFGERRLLKAVTIEPNSPLDEEQIAISELSIISLYSRMGRVYARVTTRTEPTEDPHRVELIFEVAEGPVVRVGKIRLSGNSKVKPSVVEREIVLEEGDVYNPAKLYESQKRIYGTGLFKDVKFELDGLGERRETVDITFLLAEEEARWFGVGAGYQSPDRMKLNGEWGHNNILNNGQRLTIGASYSFNLQGEHWEEINARHLEPYFLSSSFKLLLQAFHDRDNEMAYRQRETGGSASIGRYLGKSFYGSLQYRYKSATLDTLDQQALPPVEAITNSFLLSFTRDTRDPYFNPKRGSLNLISLERAGGILGGSNNFNRLIVDSGLYLPLWGRITLALRSKGGYTNTFGATTPDGVSSDQRFELGGANSVRGYDEASIGPPDPATERHNGIIMVNLNSELRFPFPLVRNLEIGYFLDCGGMWMEASEIETEDLKWGAGLGLRWIIPYVGPIRLDWGWKLAPEETEERWKWYLAVGHAY